MPQMMQAPRRPSARQAESDNTRRKTQVEIVREAWAKMEAEIKADAVMTIFLKETLDRGGADICVNVFKLVTRVLHPEGYVRRVHKSEHTNMKAFIEDEDGPWRQKNNYVDTHWDFYDTWKTGFSGKEEKVLKMC